jgi:hypothetical protein
VKKILIIGVLAALPLGATSYGQFLGEGTGGYVARNNGPTGATGGGHHEPMGFGLLATRNCWADAVVGCNATPNPPAEEPAAEAASTEDTAKADTTKTAKKKK